MKASSIADYLDTKLRGEDVEVNGFCDLTTIAPNRVVFAKKFNEETVTLLNNTPKTLAIVCPDYEKALNSPHIVSSNPRLDFIRVLSAFFSPSRPQGHIHPTAVIEPGAHLGKNVVVGPHCYIAAQVKIGDNTWIHPNVTIDNIVEIGTGCEIKSGAVIGQEGFGFERSEDGTPLHFPHFGKVVIGNNVFIGSNTTVERATLGATIIEDNAKIDDLVQIGHNSHIGANSMITVGALICGGAVIESGSYIAPNASIREKATIGNNAFVGLGAVVLHDVAPERVVVGNPAKILR